MKSEADIEIRCPDCGGIVGAPGPTSSGMPCTCFNPSADTVDESPGADEKLADKAAPKRCCKCGKDLLGHRRFKDSVGYWCKDCHRLDKARNAAPETRCPDCGRMKAIDKMVDFEGRSICSTCLKEAQKEAERRDVRLSTIELHSATEKRRLYILAGVFGVLLLVLLVNILRGLFRR